MNKLKYLIIYCFLIIFSTACTSSQQTGIANPWIECGQDLKCAKEKAGFAFPINIEKCNIRAMEDMIEIEYPFNEKNVIIRKSTGNNIGDISGDYNNYNINKELSINYIKFNIRGDDDRDKIYVANFFAKKANYAIMCDKGLNLDEIWNIYEIIKKADNL